MGRRTVYARAYLDGGGRCAYCDVELHRCAAYGSRKFGLPEGTVDHFIPRSKGGGNSRGNRVLACSTCNEGKGATDPRDGEGKIIRWCQVGARLEEIASTPMVAVAKVKARLKAEFSMGNGGVSEVAAS